MSRGRQTAGDHDDAVTTARAGAELFVPSLLAGLESGDRQTVKSAGCGLCLLAREQPETVSDIVGTLVDRLLADPREKPVLRTLAVIVEDHDREVRGALLAAVDSEKAKVLYRHIRNADGWDVAAVLAEGADEMVPPELRTVIETEYEETTPDSGTRHVETDTGGASEERGETQVEPESADVRPRSERRRHARIQQVATSDAFTAIRAESRFEELQVIEPKTERRYGDTVRTHAVDADDEYGVALRVCPAADTSGYTDALTTQFRNWQRVRSQGVVSAVDWGCRPRPWIATEYIEETLADRGELAPAAALAHAHTLTAGLAELHQYDVVHGAIDPGNVVYATDVLEERDRPMLDNVGLMTVYRQCFDPSSYLDPRYAAPEYFDSQYGSLDHATDIYQLGMVLYRVCTGRPPFEGEFDAVSRQVQKDRPPAPSSVNAALPETIDEIVAKATAKQKLTRYETAAQFHRDVERLCQSVLE